MEIIMDEYVKITNGFVRQFFKKLSDGTFVCEAQDFVAGDPVDYEDEKGEPVEVDVAKEKYFPFEMTQP